MAKTTPTAPAPVTVHRKTKETDISLTLSRGYTADDTAINTGIPFLDHMLNAFACHGNWNLQVTAQGDLEIDAHHSIEDIGLVLGEAIAKIHAAHPRWHRFGNAIIPMDDSLASAVIDMSNRPYLVYRAEFPQQLIGTLDTCLLREFFYALVSRAQINAHLLLHYSENSHHGAEALFKAFGISLSQALTPRAPGTGAPSTKGTLSV